jgi:hypothetical protein
MCDSVGGSSGMQLEKKSISKPLSSRVYLLLYIFLNIFFSLTFFHPILLSRHLPPDLWALLFILLPFYPYINHSNTNCTSTPYISFVNEHDTHTPFPSSSSPYHIIPCFGLNSIQFNFDPIQSNKCNPIQSALTPTPRATAQKFKP